MAKKMLLLIVILIIALAFVTSKYFTVITPSIDFAGFKWDTEVNNYKQPGASCDGNVVNEGEFAIVNIKTGSSAVGVGCDVSMITQLPINQIDEFLIIFDSTQSSAPESSSSASIFLTDKQRITTTFPTSTNIDRLNVLLSYSDGIGGNAQINRYFEPKIIKIKNNFDGTYSILTSLGIGDIFIVKETKLLPNVPLFLVIQSGGSGGAGGGTISTSLKVYNIVRKENAFAVCKADQFVQDKNGDGKISTDGSECFDLKTIVLNSEEAIKESYNEKLARITTELEAKNNELQIQIQQLKTQLNQQGISSSQITPLQQQISMLQSELEQTKAVLADVHANDRAVVNNIILQERFERPNFFIEFINKIIAWFKGLFKSIFT